MAAVARGVLIPAGVEIDTIWITEATLGYVLSQALPRCVSFLCKQGASFLIWCLESLEHCVNRGNNALRILNVPRVRLATQLVGVRH